MPVTLHWRFLARFPQSLRLVLLVHPPVLPPNQFLAIPLKVHHRQAIPFHCLIFLYRPQATLLTLQRDLILFHPIDQLLLLKDQSFTLPLLNISWRPTISQRAYFIKDIPRPKAHPLTTDFLLKVLFNSSGWMFHASLDNQFDPLQ